MEASTTDGGSDVSAVSSFTTLAGSALSSSKNASVDKHWITFSGRVETAGAGTTAVTLWTGESPDALVADSGRAFGEMVLDASAGTIRLSVDASSMRRSARSARQHFVLWKSGIDTDHVALVPGEGYTLRYTYGWPSVLTEPENAGDLPTGVWADVPAQAGTLILIE